MIKSIMLYLKWHKTPQRELVEVHDLIVLAARRCAYDLRHAAHSCDFELCTEFEERAEMWLSIFNPGDQGKHYRHDLHREIMMLEINIDTYRKLLKEKGIEDPVPKVPF